MEQLLRPSTLLIVLLILALFVGIFLAKRLTKVISAAAGTVVVVIAIVWFWNATGGDPSTMAGLIEEKALQAADIAGAIIGKILSWLLEFLGSAAGSQKS